MRRGQMGQENKILRGRKRMQTWSRFPEVSRDLTDRSFAFPSDRNRVKPGLR
jgi:hypothetical protein